MQSAPKCRGGPQGKLGCLLVTPVDPRIEANGRLPSNLRKSVPAPLTLRRWEQPDSELSPRGSRQTCEAAAGIKHRTAGTTPTVVSPAGRGRERSVTFPHTSMGLDFTGGFSIKRSGLQTAWTLSVHICNSQGL
ncbi:hypothetical protein Bbelb_144760 [Branchiostoma belcheri]|nr:hypothetical protein Bbelb_144760 [Branchiostoma belcheri]